MGVASRSSPAWIENRPSRGWRVVDLGQLWAYRELVGFLAWRDIRARYKQAFLGVVWHVGQPIGGMVALVLVFHRLVHVSSDGVPYAVFALLGYAVWTYVSGVVSGSTHSLIDNSNLVTKVYFPRLALPVAGLIPGLVDLLLSFVVVGVLMVIQKVSPPATIVLLPLDLLFMVVTALGIGLWTAGWNVIYRDVGHVLVYVMQLWFFASPVAYSSNLVHGAWRHLYALNPVSGLIDGFRASLLGTPIRLPDLGLSVLSAVILLATGLLTFQRLERRFADVI